MIFIVTKLFLIYHIVLNMTDSAAVHGNWTHPHGSLNGKKRKVMEVVKESLEILVFF